MAETIGDRVRKERESREISREDLAKAARMAVSTLSDLELNRSKSTTKLHRLAEHLGVSPEWLETGKGAKEAPSNNVHATGKRAELAPELEINRLQNDAKAMRYVISALVATMTIHRPAEAVEAARALRRIAPANFRAQGFVDDIASELEAAGKSETVAPDASPARSGRRSSRRA